MNVFGIHKYIHTIPAFVSGLHDLLLHGPSRAKPIRGESSAVSPAISSSSCRLLQFQTLVHPRDPQILSGLNLLQLEEV